MKFRRFRPDVIRLRRKYHSYIYDTIHIVMYVCLQYKICIYVSKSSRKTFIHDTISTSVYICVKIYRDDSRLILAQVQTRVRSYTLRDIRYENKFFSNSGNLKVVETHFCFQRFIYLLRSYVCESLSRRCEHLVARLVKISLNPFGTKALFTRGKLGEAIFVDKIARGQHCTSYSPGIIQTLVRVCCTTWKIFTQVLARLISSRAAANSQQHKSIVERERVLLPSSFDLVTLRTIFLSFYCFHIS